MDRPLFSISTPCFNSAKSIEHTLKSVLNQDFKDYEYIIVDGGSTDGTIDIIKRYEPLFEGRMKWKSEPDGGIYDAFNKGARLSTGFYCWNVNADDYLENGVLQLVANLVADIPEEEYPIVSGSLRFVYDNGTPPLVMRKTKEIAQQRYEIADMGINHPATIVPKRVYETVGYYDDRYRIMGDMDWFRRMYAKNTPILFIDDVLVNMNEGGVSTKLNFKVLAKDRWLYSKKFYLNLASQSYAFTKWMTIHLKGHLKHILVKKGVMK